MRLLPWNSACTTLPPGLLVDGEAVSCLRRPHHHHLSLGFTAAAAEVVPLLFGAQDRLGRGRVKFDVGRL